MTEDDNELPFDSFEELTEENTSPETWAFLNRDDEEYNLTYEEWVEKHKNDKKPE